jgi:photosystem II stability/assembly factor-like uncharacterized protein
MKRIIFYSLYFFYVLIINGFSQGWQILNTGVNDKFRDLYFINPDSGFIVSDGGPAEIYSTIDGGQTWIPYNSNSWSGLHSIVFVNSDTGFAVGGGAGGDAVIRKTYDSGNNWDIFFPFSDNIYMDDALFSVSFPSDSIGYVAGKVGLNGVILKTEDYGQNWDSLSIASNVYFSSIYFYNNNLGFAVGYGGNIVKTINGGTDWIIQTYTPEIDLRDITFVDSLTGFIVGANGTVLKSTDQGDTWIDLNINYSYNLNAIYFVDEFNGYAIGGSSTEGGIILKTQDGGNSWELQNSVLANVLENIIFTSPISGYLCGYDGIFARTNFPPFVNLAIKDTSLEANSGTHQIQPSLKTVFNDVDSDSLLYTVFVDTQNILASIVDSFLFITTQNDIGSFEVIVNASDDLNQTVTDTFLVNIIGSNNPPTIIGLPDTLFFSNDTVKTLNLWDFVDDDFTPDSLISFNFFISDSSLLVYYNSDNGYLNLSAPDYIGNAFLYIQAVDDSNAITMDSILCFVTTMSKIENILVEIGDQELTLHWTPRKEPELSHYDIFRNNFNDSLSANYIASVYKPDSIYLDTGLVNYNYYYYWISAIDTSNNSSLLSNTVMGRPKDLTPPITPQKPNLWSDSDRRIVVVWNIINEPDLSHFLIYENTINDTSSAITIGTIFPPNNVFEDNNFVKGITYHYWITSVDTAGNESDFSIGDSIKIPILAGISNVLPLQNQSGINSNSDITVIFDGAIDTSTITDNIIVNGNYNGVYSSNSLLYDSVANTLIFSPSNNYFTGENIKIALTDDIKYQNSDSLSMLPYMWDFTVKSTESSGRFGRKIQYATSLSKILSVTSGDYDGDGDIDLALSYDEVHIYTNVNGNFIYLNSYSQPASKIISVDYDKDGDLDLIVYSINKFCALENNGNASFTSTEYILGGLWSVVDILANDWDGDGFCELILSGGKQYYIHNNNGVFDYSIYRHQGWRALGSSGGDIDRDGKPDLISVESGDKIIVEYWNVISRFIGFYDTTYTIGGYPNSYIQADLNNDLNVDLAVTDTVSKSLVFLLNNGKGKFPHRQNINFTSLPQIVSYGDFNGDSFVDLLLFFKELDECITFINGGNLQFSQESSITIHEDDIQITSADFRNTGKLDFIITNKSNGTFKHILNNSSPLSFNLVNPALNDTIYSTSIYFKWEASIDVDLDTVQYIFHLENQFKDTSITGLVNNELFFQGSNFIETGLRYNWTVVATDRIDTTWSNQNGFFFTASILGLDSTANIPLSFSLKQNYPNPFNSKTTIKYSIAERSNVEIYIYNTIGQLIKSFIKKNQKAGIYSIQWDASNCASGIYLYQIKTDQFVNTKKMVLLK